MIIDPVAADEIIKYIVFAVFLGVIYFIIAYHLRWNWRATLAGKIIMGTSACLMASSILSAVGEQWPRWEYRPLLRVAGWSFMLVIVLIMCVSMMNIKKPPKR